MARRNKNKIKELGDQKLVTEIEKLQNRLALEQDLDQNTLDLSDDNYIQGRILKAKYTFLYNEARHRGTRFSGITNAITQ
ncbi:YaaL family protein [Lactobacillus gallinarum]|uniref:YaaL family protein n=1 Tax=Lactobacillus gallinarum TaxID=52242 RepID=UPI0024B1B201|nr:YaaL family protein [Lactobacillus gallinarum]